MRKPRLPASMVSVGLMLLGADLACGQDFPNRPIRIVTSPIGGGGDFASRIIAHGLTAGAGWQVIVENRPSGSTAEIVSKSPPDGYTILLSGTSFWLAQFLRESVPYDVERDFSPVSLAQISPNMMVVHPSLPVRSVKDLIVLAKARPGELNYATSGSGSSNHLAGELFKAMASVNITRINYKGVGPSLNDLIGGQVQLSFGAAGGVAPHIKSGKLRALAVTTARPSALFPDLPTIGATVPGYDAASLTGLFAPVKTPAPIVSRLNQEIVRALGRPDVIERFRNSGAEAAPTTPEQFAATIKSEMARMGKVIKDAGIRED